VDGRDRSSLRGNAKPALGPGIQWGVLVFAHGRFTNSDLIFTGTFSAGTLSFMYQVSSWAPFGLNFSAVEFFHRWRGGHGRYRRERMEVLRLSDYAGAHTLQWRFKNSRSMDRGSMHRGTPPWYAHCADRA
jgi:hypothetical protein